VRGVVERVELAVRDPHEPCEQLLQTVHIPVAEDLAPPIPQTVQDGRMHDAVVGARLQVHGRAAGHVARQCRAGDRLGGEVLRERGQDHVAQGRFERVADEPSPHRAVGVLADAVGFHARLLEQPPVDGELPLDRVLGLRQRDVSVDRPPFGVLAVERLVERDAEAAEHRAALEPAGDDLLAGSEQRVGVEVDRPGVDLDVPGVR
jgi:hypothetical protein